MRKIEATIRPSKLHDVMDALFDMGIWAITVSEIKDFSPQYCLAEYDRGAAYATGFQPKLRLEIVVPDYLASQAVEAIAGEAQTGRAGDGQVFVFPVVSARRIRTGELNEEAVQ